MPLSRRCECVRIDGLENKCFAGPQEQNQETTAQSGFVRTPKYGIGEGKANSSSQAKSSRYKTMKSMMPIIELAFAVFFGVVVVSNFIDADYVTAVLLCPFPIGFFYTSVPSLYRMLPISRKNEEGAIVDEGK